jgi:hypothetical protein
MAVDVPDPADLHVEDVADDLPSLPHLRTSDLSAESKHGSERDGLIDLLGRGIVVLQAV